MTIRATFVYDVDQKPKLQHNRLVLNSSAALDGSALVPYQCNRPDKELLTWTFRFWEVAVDIDKSFVFPLAMVNTPLRVQYLKFPSTSRRISKLVLCASYGILGIGVLQRNQLYSVMDMNAPWGSSRLTTESNPVKIISRPSSLVRAPLTRMWCALIVFRIFYLKPWPDVTGGWPHSTWSPANGLTTGPAVTEYIRSQSSRHGRHQTLEYIPGLKEVWINNILQAVHWMCSRCCRHEYWDEVVRDWVSNARGGWTQEEDNNTVDVFCSRDASEISRRVLYPRSSTTICIVTKQCRLKPNYNFKDLSSW